MTREIAAEDAHSIAPDRRAACLCRGRATAGSGGTRAGARSITPPSAPSSPASCWRCFSPRSNRPSSRRRCRRSEEPGRYRRSVLGGDRLSARRDGGDAAVRKALRHLRPPCRPARRDRASSSPARWPARWRRSIWVLILGARSAGHRRRRPVADRADHHRRPVVAARAPGGAGPHLDHVHEREHPRPGARRLAHRSSALVADFLDQSAARRRSRW